VNDMASLEFDYERGGLQRDTYGSADVEEVPCPLCGGEGRDRLYVERGALGIVRCRGCALIYVSPRLRNPEQVYWGDAQKYVREARLIFEGKAAHHRDPNYLADLALLERFKPSGALLDVGTNMGFFLRHTRGRRWDVTGIEPSPSLSALARKYFGLNVVTGFLEDARFPDGSFDVVTMTDVFEHISDPRGLLREVRRVLRPGGIVFIKVPNGLSSLLKLRVLRALRRAHAFDIFDSYEHVVHYSERTLRRMLSESGFRPRYRGIARPIQLPAWHRYVGAYYQYPSPWVLDWKRHLARPALYWLSRLERVVRANRIGWLAPAIVMIAEKEPVPGNGGS